MATTPYCSWEAVKLRCAAALHKAAADLPAQFDDIFSQATKDAAAEIKRIFVLKGYTPAQVASADDVRVWNEQLAAFYALERLAPSGGIDPKTVEYLDCRKEMKEAAALVIGDAAVGPAADATDVGGVAHGRLTAAEAIDIDPDTRDLDTDIMDRFR